MCRCLILPPDFDELSRVAASRTKDRDQSVVVQPFGAACAGLEACITKTLPLRLRGSYYRLAYIMFRIPIQYVLNRYAAATITNPQSV